MILLAARIFSFILAAIAVSKSYVDFRARRESLQMFLFWLITWTAIVVIAMFPWIIDLTLMYFGGGRAGLGTFFGMAIVFLFFVVYRMYVKLDRMQQILTKTIQDLALHDWKSRK